MALRTLHAEPGIPRKGGAGLSPDSGENNELARMKRDAPAANTP